VAGPAGVRASRGLVRPWLGLLVPRLVRSRSRPLPGQPVSWAGHGLGWLWVGHVLVWACRRLGSAGCGLGLAGRGLGCWQVRRPLYNHCNMQVWRPLESHCERIWGDIYIAIITGRWRDLLTERFVVCCWLWTVSCGLGCGLVCVLAWAW
jgi:hypothetical protein